ANPRDDVVRHDFAFTKRMLRGRRTKSPSPVIRYRRAIAQSPDVRPSLKLERFRYQQSTTLFWTGNRIEQGIRSGPCGPNECVRGNRGPVTQTHGSARQVFDLCVEANFDFAPCQFSLSVLT